MTSEGQIEGDTMGEPVVTGPIEPFLGFWERLGRGRDGDFKASTLPIEGRSVCLEADRDSGLYIQPCGQAWVFTPFGSEGWQPIHAFALAMVDIEGVTLDIAERVSIWRFLLVGPFAFLWKVRDKYLVVDFRYNGRLESFTFSGPEREILPIYDELRLALKEREAVVPDRREGAGHAA